MTHSRTSEITIEGVLRQQNQEKLAREQCATRLWLAKARATNALLLGHLLLGWAMVANLMVEQPPNINGVVAALLGYVGAWAYELLPEWMEYTRVGAATACILGTVTSWLCFLVSLYLGA